LSKRPGKVPREDEILALPSEDCTHIVSENHFYKTEGYYALVKNEVNGVNTLPRSSDVIDAYVVPICLEKAKLCGVEVCHWEISYTDAPAPCIIYGVNYFSTPGEFFVAQDLKQSQQAVKHVTNNGRYPFCYQPLGESDMPKKSNVIFGRIASDDPALANLASGVYEAFHIPLVSMIYVTHNGVPQLSSLGPVKYSKLNQREKEMLGSRLGGTIECAGGERDV